MIKVNLLRNRGDNTVKTSGTQVNYDSMGEVSSETTVSPKELINKIIIMLLGVGLLMLYETFHIDGLRSELATLNAQNMALQTELNQKKPLADKAKQLQKEIQDIEARIKSIKDLSRFRLREIRAIDYVQNVIPERVWLTKMDFNEGSLKIEGGAISDDQLNRFLESLESKAYFSNVILLKAIEEKTKDGTIKRFDISSNLTNAE